MYRYGGTISVNVDVDVDLDDVLEELDDDEVRELYEARFGSGKRTATTPGVEFTWTDLYDKRRSMPESEFVKLMDTLIQDITGRIL